ncbi:B12-binding domain-containing radical SAM protein [Candidatus Omnitrophota bacterium]
MLFINPELDEISQPRLVRKFTYACFPTSIGYLAAYLKRENKVVSRVVDEQMGMLSKDSLEGELSRLKGPKVVGITNLTATTKRVIDLTKEIKSIDPKVTVILGGVHASVLPEAMLMKSSADIVVRREGELTLSELYEKLRNGSDYSGVRGISYKKASKVIHNPDRELIKALDDLPPFYYELFEDNIGYYGDFGTIISSRGCPFNCIFCSQRVISGNSYRFYSVPRVVDNIKKLVDKYHQKKIWFVDDSVTINKKRLYELLDGIIKSGYHKKVDFIGTTRAKELTREMLKKLKECNFVSLGIGVETGSERLMKIINKNELVEDNVRAIKMCREEGIITDASLVFGLPTETRKERYDTLRLMKRLPLDGARFNVAVPYPGTELYNIGKQESRLHIHENWSNCCNQYYIKGDDLPYVPGDTNSFDLIFDTIVANALFYLRPLIIFKILFKSPLSGGGVLSLPKRWYIKPNVLWSLARFFGLVAGRITAVFAKVLIARVTKKKEKRVNEIIG